MKPMICIAAGLLLFGAVSAQAEQRPRTDGRYIITPVEDGILRVDRKTGRVSHCASRQGEWSCEPVEDEPGGDRRYGAYEEEYDDLGPGGVMSKKEVDEAMDTLEYMMDRLMGVTGRLRERGIE